MTMSEREPRVREERVDVHQIKAYCPECGDPLERADNVMLPTDPPKYRYQCSYQWGGCEYTTVSSEIWPRVEYRPIVH